MMAWQNPTEIQFFENQLAFRSWLEKNHLSAREIWVGYYKLSTQKPSLTWSESVDQALCFGWIDGIRKSLQEQSYTIRFTPRNPKSIWSKVNLQKMESLLEKQMVYPAGKQVYDARSPEKSEIYAFEQRHIEFPEDYLVQFQQNSKAWQWFEKAPATYQKTALWWVLSAKQENTRLKRLQTLIQDSAEGLKIISQRR